MLMNFDTFFAIFSLHVYLNIHGLQKGPGKFFMGSWKVLEKSWIFFSKRVGTLVEVKH